MKKTSLFEIHESLGAKIVEFAGFMMPIQYTGVTDEHIAVRERSGLFDVSHMGEIWIEGSQAIAFLQFVTSNDIEKLNDGDVQYSCFPNGKGGIVDDIIVYRILADKFLLVVNASNIEKDYDWLVSQNKAFGAVITNASDQYAQLALQGPKSKEILSQLTSLNLDELSPFTFNYGDVAGINNVLISNTGYTGSGGYEIYCANDQSVHIWNAILEKGAANISPAGLACRDTLRLEKGYCLYGNDINDETSPIEAGLGWITKFNKDSDFVDRALLLDQKEHGVKRKLVGFKFIDRGIPRKDYEITDEQGNALGVVTSGTHSPTLNKAIGMGYVVPSHSKAGSAIYVEVRNRLLKAEVVKLPFL